MKNIRYFVLSALALAGLASCQKTYDMFVTDKGPEMTVVSYSEEAPMGGAVKFAVTLNDQAPLSTLKGELYFDDAKVSDVEIRTKTNGTYEGEVAVPFYKNIPDGTAVLRLIGQNTGFGLTTVECEVKVSRPEFDYLTFMLDGQEYKMEPTAEDYVYSVTASFPTKAKGYIVSPSVDADDHSVTFGWDGSGVAAGIKTVIPFSNTTAGEYSIWFNVLTFECGPFTSLKLNGQEMAMIDEDNYRYVGDFKKGDVLQIDGIADLSSWWIDPDFFKLAAGENSVELVPMSGRYGITANFKYNYLICEVYGADGKPMSLQEDGTGGLWVVGEKIGKPSLSNQVGWNTGKALCMAPIAKGKFQVTGVAGVSLGTDAINFKFYGAAKDWGNEFKSDRLSTTSTLVGVGTGEVDDTGNKHDNGNLYLRKDVKFAAGDIYTFTVDVTAGQANAVLTVEKVGHQELPVADIKVNGKAMEQVQGDDFAVVLDLNQGDAVTMTGADAFTPAWINPDFFTVSGASVTLAPLSGKYKVMANISTKVVTALPVNADGSLVKLSDDGHGALYFMGYGLGSPSLANEPGWSSRDLCVPEFASKIYKFTAQAGKEGSEVLGQRIKLTGWNGKFFRTSSDWGDIGTLTLAGDAAQYLKITGNIETADGKSFEEGATYEITVDLTGGVDNPVLSVVKK